MTLLFEPSLYIGQAVTVQNTLAPWANGKTFKVIGIHHHGTISASSSDTCLTDISLFNVQAPVGVGIPAGTPQ